MAKTHSELKAYNRAWFKTPKGRYHQHKGGAYKRGIEFLLTFEEWWNIWQASGKWEQRGKFHGQYVMARFGDRGAYEIGNVRIATVGENVVENTSRLPARGFCTPEFREQLWTPEFRAKIAAVNKARPHKPISDETRAKMSAARKAHWVGVPAQERSNRIAKARASVGPRKRDKNGRFT